MRTKTIGVRPRFPHATLPKPSSTTPPVLNLDEPNKERSIDRNVPEIYCECDHEQNEDDEDGCGDIASDSVDGMGGHAKKRHPLGTKGAGMDIDWLKAETCIMCDRGGDQLLVCCEIGCPVSLHDKCMDSERDFDDVENFYCPYCWYKRQVLKSIESREKAMVAKKALSDFIDSEMVGGNERKKNPGKIEGEETNLLFGGISNPNNRMENDELQSQPMQLEKDKKYNKYNAELNDCVQLRRVVGHETDPLALIRDEKAAGSELREGIVDEDGERRHAQDSRKVDDVLHEGMVEDQQGEPLNAFCKEEEKSADGSLHLLTKETCDSMKEPEEEQEKAEKEKQMHPNAAGTTMSSTRSANDCIDSDAETLGVPQRHVKPRIKRKAPPQNVVSSKKSSSRPGPSAVGNGNQDNTASKTSRQLRSTNRLENLTFHNEKRQRLHWSAEEEEILREGVQKFSTSVNKNLPWRKILEFGQHVFHETRTPTDLKDKWRNIMAKESATCSRS